VSLIEIRPVAALETAVHSEGEANLHCARGHLPCWLPGGVAVGGAWGHTFIPEVYLTTEGEYALSEAMPHVRIIAMSFC